MNSKSTIRIAAVGLNHGHIYGQVDLLLRAGAELVAFYAVEPDLAAQFSSRYPQARLARSVEEILEDRSIHMVVSAAIPDERGPLGIEVMRHEKDYMSDKPAFTTLEQLDQARQVQAETGRIFSICYSERLENPATVRAGELVKSGVIGTVVQTIGMGPHRANLPTRPAWFFQRERYGGILCDIASHQMDQFLFFTGATSASVVCAQVGNFKHPEYPGLEDFGEAMLCAESASGHLRVDWYTPDGLEVWGDARLFILGTEGYMEVRKYIDLQGRPGGNHLFWVDGSGTHYEDCSGGDLPYGRQLVQDVLERSQTAMSQAHCFLAMQLALEAEAKATRLRALR
jgi:predicted dehydrogenase